MDLLFIMNAMFASMDLDLLYNSKIQPMRLNNVYEVQFCLLIQIVKY